MPKKYRRKPQAIKALKTYIGQPMTDIRDFLLGSSVYVSVMEHGNVFEERLEGALDVTPGDYILRSYDGQVTACKSIEFEKIYEEDNQDALESGLAHALHLTYGFSVDEAFKALTNKDIRNFLLASLETRATSQLKALKVDNPISIQGEARDVGSIAEKITDQLHKNLRLH